MRAQTGRRMHSQARVKPKFIYLNCIHAQIEDGQVPGPGPDPGRRSSEICELFMAFIDDGSRGVRVRTRWPAVWALCGIFTPLFGWKL